VNSLLHRSSIVALVLMFSQPALAQTKSSPFVARETHVHAGYPTQVQKKKWKRFFEK